MWNQHIWSSPFSFRWARSAETNARMNFLYSGPVESVSHPKMRLYSLEPSSAKTVAMTFGAWMAPHWEKRCEISKYFIPFSSARDIYLSRRE